MGVKGKSFTGSFSGAHVDFSVGTLAQLFNAGFTIAVLTKQAVGSSNNGMFGAFADTSATTAVRQFFTTANTHARLYGDGDFSDGYPSATELPNGLDDGTVRWVVTNKPSGAAHYRMHYADLATLTWSHGESNNAANHNDVTTDPVMFTTWAIYAMGFGAQETYAIAAWDSSLSDAAIESALTHKASDLFNANPGFFVLFDDEFGSVRSNWTPPSIDSALQDRNLGFLWSSTKAVTIDGLLWFQPNNANKPTTVQARIYNSDGSSILADSGSVDATGFSANAWNLITFPSLFVPSLGTTYVASIYCNGAVQYDPDDLASAAISSGEGWITVPQHGSRFTNSAIAFPTTSYDGFFGLDLNYYIPKVEIMGSGADENHRQFIVPTLNPVNYDFTLGSPHTAGQFLPFF